MKGRNEGKGENGEEIKKRKEGQKRKER